MWSGGKKVQALKELVAACGSKSEAPFADVEQAFDKALRTVRANAECRSSSMPLNAVWNR